MSAAAVAACFSIATALAVAYAGRAGWLGGALARRTLRCGGAVPGLRRAPAAAAGPAGSRFDALCAEADHVVALAGERMRGPPGLVRACRMALAGGKRLRPAIVIDIARATQARTKTAVDPAEAAAAVEMLHVASLVLDDTPAFDDDAARRGRPALHVAVGLPTAQMAALALVGAAIDGVGKQCDAMLAAAATPAEAMRALAAGRTLAGEVGRLLGSSGAAGGQYLDSVATPEEVALGGGLERGLLGLVELKTARFFELAFVAGWLVGGGSSPSECDLVREAGRLFGTAFQLADDIGDRAADAARAAAGKPGWNYANEFGEAPAAARIRWCLEDTETILRGLGLLTGAWREMVEKLMSMAD